MDASARFAFLAEAFDGSGGFAPRVTWENQLVISKDQQGNPIQNTRRVPKLAAPCHLVPYTRESNEKFAARAAVAVFEHHLRDACERFVGFLGRRPPNREGTEAPLVQLLLNDADLRGTPLDQFVLSFALQAVARGSMLLLIDMPGEPDEDAPASLAEQIQRRKVPYLRAIKPEMVAAFDIDDETGLFESISIKCCEDVNGKTEHCIRIWDATSWRVMHNDVVIRQGEHGFGQCPVLAFTENGGEFPQFGRYASIADLSRRIFNARSELDEILRGQTFSLLTLQVPPEASASFDASTVSATVSTQNMLVHAGATPAFISPDSGPAEVYLQVIQQLRDAISYVAMDSATSDTARHQESGIARRLRFERLNSALASFAGHLAALERRMWVLFHRVLATDNRVVVQYPTDFNLVDSLAELDILASMQDTGFPEQVLSAKRRAIVAAEFDTLDADHRAELMRSVDESIQAAQGA